MQEINFPEDVRKMLWILLGEMPLQARENLAWLSRALYLDLGKQVLELRDAVQKSVRNAGSALPDDVARGYVQGLSLLTDDGGTDRLQELVDQLDDMADGQIDYSMKIQESKWEIIAEIVMLLIELAFLAAMAFFTGGTSISEMALARARSRLALLMIIDRLLRMTHIAPALSGAFTEAIQTLAVKLAQIAFNPPGRKPDGIDWGDVGKAAAFGAFGGIFESVGGYISNKFRDWLRNGGDHFDNLDIFVPKPNPIVSKGLNDLYDVPAVFVVSGLSETAAEVLVTGLFDGNWEFKWETFVGSGTSGVFGMYAESAVGGGALWLREKFIAPPVDPGGVNELPRTGGSGGADGPTRPVPSAGPGPLTGSGLPLATGPLTTGPLTTGPLTTGPLTTGPLATGPLTTAPLTTGPLATGPLTSTPPIAAPLPSPNASSPEVAPPPAYSVLDPLDTTLTPDTRTGLGAIPTSGSMPSGHSLSGSPPSSLPTTLPTQAQSPVQPLGTTEFDTDPVTEATGEDGVTSKDPTQPSSSAQPPAARGVASGTPEQRQTGMADLDGEGTEPVPGNESPGAPAAAPHPPASSPTAAPQPSSSSAARTGAGLDQPGPAEAPEQEGSTDPGTASERQEDPPGVPGPDAGPATGRPEAVGASGPVSGTTAPGSPAWEAARAAVEPIPRSHTWVDPVSAPPDPQRPGQTTQFAVRSKFDVRRFELDGDHITDLTVRVGAGSPDRMPDGVWDKVLSGVETALNAPGHRLPNGDLLHVTVERVESDPHPNGLNVGFVGRDQQMTRSAWWADADPVDYAHEITHMLGLRDESRHAVAPHRPDVEGSLLGDYRRPAPEGLAQGGLRDRHLQLISRHIGDLAPTATATTATTTATAPDSVPPPVRRPATTSTTTSAAPGAEPYAPVLPSTRPPVLDRDLPRPLGGRRDRAGFGDGSRMPAYIDDVQELVQDAPPGVLLELVSGGMTFGHSDVVLRGTAQALAEIGRVLSAADGTVRPAQPKKGRPAGSSLMDDVTYAFAQEPKTLAGDGRVFPYTAQDGSVRKLSVTARHYGDWEQFTDTYGSPVKVDGMHRSVFTAGQSKTMQSTTQIALGGPIGPVGAAAFSGFGRIGLRLGFTDRVGYGQTEQGTSQTETRALDGSRVYLDHVYYDLRVTDVDGGIVTTPEPAVFGFAVRDGLSVRLPDSVTSTTATIGRIPRSMELSRQSAYRLVRTEGFGPVSRMRDWAAQEIGAAPGSTAYGELNSFFSSLSFQRQSPALSRGRVTTVPLFADDKARTPLGVFVVDVVPGRATLITETPDAEMRDINTLAVRNDRSVQKTAAIGIDGVAGPAFNFFDLGNGALNLRLQFGGAFRYLFSVSRTAGLGGSGAIKTAGQVKGDATGLYLVRKTVYVQRSGSGTRPQQFHTWSVDRMTRTEARRLAGWDDGLRRSLLAGASEPFAPAYLTPDRPPTLGMHRVEEFAFGDGTKTGPAGATGRERTLLDTFADEVLTALAAEYPGLVARLDQLAPPGRGTTTRWRNDDEYRTALANTLEVLSALSHRSMAGNLEALTTTGIRIRFNEPGRIGQGHRYIWLRGELTNRRFEGVQDDFKLRYSSVGVERVDGQKSAKRIGEAGVEGLLAFRDPMTDDIGAPNNSGGPSAGVRWGWQNDEETSFGATATYEPMTVSAGPSHLYRYDLSLTVDRGGYWRFRGLLRGVATLGLLGTQPFVFSQPQGLLIGTAPGGRRIGGGPLAAQVLISIPGTHAPAVDPHHRGAANPYASVALQPVRTLRPGRARALALGDLSRPGSLVRATDLVGDPGPVTADGRGSQMFRDLQNHPFLTIGVVSSPALVSALGQTMTAGSGGAWQLTEEGAPTREAVLRAFQPQYLTANFDQSSGPLGWTASGLMGKGPYASLWATFRHLTAVDGIQALTGSVPMDTEMVLGGTGQTAGKLTRTRTFFVGGQLVYARSHAAGPGLLGTYGLVASPWSTADQSSRTVTRSFVHDMNRKGFGHQVLVSGTAEHWLALTSSLLGSGAAGRPLVPDWIAAAAGRMTTVPGGWLAHVPEKSAHMVGLIDDGMGEVPRYTRHRWSPQPWLQNANFGTYAVNSLDPATALAAFEQQVAALGLDDAGRERVRTLVSSRVLRSLDKEMTGSGSSAPARTGAWGWHSIRLGKRQIRIRVQLEPGPPTFEMLDHSVEMEENRRAIETVTEGTESTKGADFGYLVGEAVHTENPTGAVAAGPTFTETGSGRKSSGESRTETTLTVFRAASTEPYAEIATPYTLRITLEADDPSPGPRGAVRKGFDRFRGKQVISVARPAGTLREHVPLSLMSPDADPGADLLPPPDLTGLAAPRQGISPYVLGPDTRHGDGTLKPFRLPATGFDVRRIVGLADIQAANTYALALSYDAGFSMDGPDAARRARDNGLTRLGTGSAQALEDGSGNAALTAYYHRAVTPQGYGIPGLTEKNIAATESAQLELYAKPDFSRARLLTVADGKKMEMLRRTGVGAAASVGRENVQDSAFGAGVLISSDKTGLHQMGGSGTGPYAAEGDALPTSADQLTSINTKPKTGRVFLFAVPTSWLSVADVRRGIKDTPFGRFVGGTFGHIRPGPKAVASEAYALTWVRDDVARELGLIDDTNFPARVGAAWDAVGKASKAWVDGDKAYWKKRRSAIGLREERDAAQITLDDAETAAGVEAGHLAGANRAAEAPRAALAAATARLDEVRAEVREARDALETAVESAGEVAHDGWAELMREQIAEARSALAATEGQLPALEDRVTTLRGPVEEAARNVARAEEAVAASARRVGAATRRRDAAVTAFGNRRALLDALRTTAEDAAAEYHRVRAATDQLTRWHQEAATEAGRARLAGREEPPAVTYRKPAADPPPPALQAPPAPPVYTRTGVGEDARLTSPDQVTYALHEVARDGDAFLHALVEGLSRSAPELLTDQGVDLGDRRAAADAVLRMLAARLTDPADADLLDAVAPDGTDAFSDAEATAAGLRGAGPLGAGTPGGREFDGLGGLMPHSVTPGPEARAALAVAQLMRPGNTDGEAGWNHGAADLLPLLAARTFGVDITVVDGDGRFQDFGPAPSDPTGHLAGTLDVLPGGPRPRVVLSLADRHYQLAVPAGVITETPEPEPELEPVVKPEPEPEPEVKPKPKPSPGAARGRPVRVPGTGACLFLSFMASDPGYVRSRLPGLAESHPAAYAWLDDADAVRRELSGRAVVRSATGYYPGGPETAVVDAMRTAVEDYLIASEGRLPPSVIGQLRLSAVADFRSRIARTHRAGLVTLLEHHGVDADTLVDGSEAGLRTELATLYPTSEAPLDTAELHAVLDAVSRWEDRYMTDVGEAFLPLLAHTFEARVEVAFNGLLADVRRAGPSGASRVVEVHYNGVDHYDGSGAEPTDLLVFGDSVAPKRVKPEEQDAEGDVRVNPLWVALDEVDPALLITGSHDAVWIYTVTEDGRVLLGSEQPSTIVTPEQFDALLAGMRRVTPELTAEELRNGLDGLGHTGIAARFEKAGRSEPGMSRVSGEFRWSPELGRWTVNDKSGRYMSGAVRPGLDPDVAAGWLAEVAGLFTERLGVRVVPEQVKTASAAAPPDAPAPAPPPVVPLKGMVSLAELDAIGVTLSLAQATTAALLGDELPVAGLELTLEQHRLVRVQRGEPDTSEPTELLLDSSDPSSPGSSADSLDMIMDWEDGESLSDEGSESGEPDHHQILVDLYGPGIDTNPLYATLRDTLTRLDTLRQAGPEAPLNDGPFDLDAVTRYVLGLGEQEAVTKAQHGELFRVALDENVEGARSLAALAAFRLMLDGVFSVARTLPRTGGSRGRNWTGGKIRNLDTSQVDATAQQPYGGPPSGATGPAPYVVLATEGGHDHVVVLDGSGTSHRVAMDVFAELLALDPVLAGLSADVPLVLLVPEAGARGLSLPRMVAHATGRTTWATSGRLRFTPQTEGGPASVSPEHRPGETEGTWIVSEPGQVLDPAVRRGAQDWESSVVSYTFVREGRSIGRFVLHPEEAARVEGLMRQMPATTEFWHKHAVTGAMVKDPGPVPWVGRPAYFFAIHGLPGMTLMTLDGGVTHLAGRTATGGFLRRRPSVAQLSDDHVIVMDACWHATSGSPDFINGESPLAPYVPDPLGTVSDAQHTANATGRTVFASTRPSGIGPQPSGALVRYMPTDHRGRQGRWLEFRPEPVGAALDEVARAAGLHLGNGPATPQARDAALRLVRALRNVFGAGVDQDGDYARLLSGIGALERMRSRDPSLADATPFTMDLLDQAVRAIRGPSLPGAGPGTPLSADDYRAALLHTATAPGTDGPLTAFVPLPRLEGTARRLGAFTGPAALNAETARVLRLPAGAGVGPAQRARLFWATAAALEWEHRTPDPDTAGARILHLGGPDPARRGELIDLLARASAAGRDLDRPAEVAAFHLEVLGAFAPETLLRRDDGTTAGRTWYVGPRTPGPLSTANLDTAVPRPGGGVQPGGSGPAPWATPGSPDPYVVWAPGDSGHLLMSLPGSPVMRVPYEEVGELLSRDRELAGRPLRTDVVLAVRDAGTGAGPRTVVSALTGRAVWTTTDKVFLTGGTAPGSPYAVVVLRNLVPGNLVPDGPAAAAAAWSRVRYGYSAQPVPATPVVPQSAWPRPLLPPPRVPGP